MKAAAARWLGEQGALKEGVLVVALGGNLGGKEAVEKRCESALEDLSKDFGLARRSSYWVTAPVGEVQEQPDFLNAVAAWRPPESPHPRQVLATLQALELQHGRTRDLRGGARTLDLDLLFVGQQTSGTAALLLPHPRMHLRAFVLRPLEELFGGSLRLHPGGPTVASCLAAPAIAAQAIHRSL